MNSLTNVAREFSVLFKNFDKYDERKTRDFYLKFSQKLKMSAFSLNLIFFFLRCPQYPFTIFVAAKSVFFYWMEKRKKNRRLGSRGRFISERAMCLSRSGAIQIRYWPRLCEEPRMRVAIDRSRYEKTWRKRAKAKVIAAPRGPGLIEPIGSRSLRFFLHSPRIIRYSFFLSTERWEEGEKILDPFVERPRESFLYGFRFSLYPSFAFSRLRRELCDFLNS